MKNPVVLDITAQMLTLSDDIGYIISQSANGKEAIQRLKDVRKDIDKAIELAERLEAYDKEKEAVALPLLKGLEKLCMPVQFVIAMGAMSGASKPDIIQKLRDTAKTNTEMLENGDFDKNLGVMQDAIQAQKDFPVAIDILEQVQKIEDGEA